MRGSAGPDGDGGPGILGSVSGMKSECCRRQIVSLAFSDSDLKLDSFDQLGYLN